MKDHDDGNPGASRGGPSIASRQVAWWPTHEFLEAVLAQANYSELPTAGTPSWSLLADSDPRKLLALAQAGEHWVLRVEVAQAAAADASRTIAAAADWGQLGRDILQRRGTYIRRVVA